MTCEEAELELCTSEEISPAVREHLSSCDACRAFQASSAQLLADAALPAPSVEEKASQQTLAPRVHQQWQKLHRRRSFVRRVAGLAMAACVGAAVASAALMPKLQHREVTPTEVPEWGLSEPELVSQLDTEDELEAFEVSWPSP